MVNWHPLKPFGTLWKVQVCILLLYMFVCTYSTYPNIIGYRPSLDHQISSKHERLEPTNFWARFQALVSGEYVQAHIRDTVCFLCMYIYVYIYIYISYISYYHVYIWSNNTISPTWISLKQEISLPKNLPFEGLRSCEGAITAIFVVASILKSGTHQAWHRNVWCAPFWRGGNVLEWESNHGNPEPTFFGGLKPSFFPWVFGVQRNIPLGN